MPEEIKELPKVLQDKLEYPALELDKRMNDLHAKGQLLQLTPEEITMLKHFKKFKNSLITPAVFAWSSIPWTEQEREVMNKLQEDNKA